MRKFHPARHIVNILTLANTEKVGKVEGSKY